MFTERASQLFRSFRKREYRQAFAAEVGTGLATQIKLLREARFGRQKDLADHLRMKQAQVSQLESPDYGRFSLSTLLRLAGAFDVPLIVRFGNWSELADWHGNLSKARLAPQDYEQESAALQTVTNRDTDGTVAQLRLPILTTVSRSNIISLEDCAREASGTSDFLLVAQSGVR